MRWMATSVVIFALVESLPTIRPEQDSYIRHNTSKESDASAAGSLKKTNLLPHKHAPDLADVNSD
jgi:hypothetical protein